MKTIKYSLKRSMEAVLSQRLSTLCWPPHLNK